MIAKDVAAAARKVVDSGNCSGCGMCTLLDPSLEMRIDQNGFTRPVAVGGVSPRRGSPEYTDFRRSCPGRRVDARRDPRAVLSDPVFGSYVSAWKGWAADDATRDAGSSGGVISALSAWMTSTGAVTAVSADDERPTRSIPVTLHTSRDSLAAAGSRYAPVAALSNPDTLVAAAIVGKPCEIGAVRAKESEGADSPLLISFFCAGVPSQLATDDLVRKLGLDPDLLKELRYRGDGWPGNFAAVDQSGNRAAMSYDESWGRELGPTMQWRCKICPDGTAQNSDVVAGDYWQADERGYPLFTESAGESLIIARTARGDEALRAAAAAGIVHLEAIDISSLYGIQPLQVERRRQLLGRLVGATLAGKRVPSYRGFGLWWGPTRRPLRDFVRPLVGSFLRLLRAHKDEGTSA